MVFPWSFVRLVGIRVVSVSSLELVSAAILKAIKKIVICQFLKLSPARLAQSVEHETLNLRVVGSSPTLGEQFFLLIVNAYVVH